MPAVVVAHGRMKAADHDDDGRTSHKERARISRVSQNSTRMTKNPTTSATLHATTSTRLPPGFITKTGATELTHPKTINNKTAERSITKDQKLVERLLSSKLFGDLMTRGGTANVKAARKSTRLGRIVQSAYFKIGITILICLSALEMGLATDIGSASAQIYWDVCEQIFTTVFAVEVVLKLIVDGMVFFLDTWNIIDFLIAFSSGLDAWILPLSGVDANIGFIRTFRLLRLLRIMRMLRIIPEILMVMEGIGASLRSLFWIIILLVAVLYACSIMCVELLGKAQDGFPGYSEEVDALLVSSTADDFNNYMFFGTVARSMVSLLGIVFLAEWDTIIRPVFEEFPAMILIFAFIVVLMTLGVLNIIVGVIVENTTQAMERERRSKEEEGKAQKMQFIEELSAVFENIDEDSDGALSWYECQKAALRGDEKLAQLVFDIDFPPGITFEEIFQMLDVDASGALTQDEFINGMFRIVHCDDFQRDCLNYLAVGRVMSKMNSDKVEIVNSIRREVRRAVQEALGGELSCSTSPQSSRAGSPGRCMSPGSFSPASYKGYLDSGASDSCADYASEQDEGVSSLQEALHGVSSNAHRELKPIYEPLAQADMLTRLQRAAKEAENKMGALVSILYEEQYNSQFSSRNTGFGPSPTDKYARTYSDQRQSRQGRHSPEPGMPELRTGIFAAHGNSPVDSQSSQRSTSGQDRYSQWGPHAAERTKPRLNSSQVGKAATVYASQLACTPGRRLPVDRPAEGDLPRNI